MGERRKGASLQFLLTSNSIHIGHGGAAPFDPATLEPQQQDRYPNKNTTFVALAPVCFVITLLGLVTLPMHLAH